MCPDKEVVESGECLYISVKNCVLPQCAFEEIQTETENLLDAIETGGGAGDKINIDKLLKTVTNR
jgi:hypothetical protein